MTSIDTIARSSANAIHTSVARVETPVGGIAGLAQAAAIWKMAGYAVAGATAGAAVVFALLIAAPTEQDPAENVVPTTSVVVPTTVAETVVTPTTLSEPPKDERVAAVPDDENDEATEPQDVEPPHLEVVSPRNGEHIDKTVVTFSGRTEPGADVLASGKFPVAVSEDGLWSVELVLAPGANGVVFTATDAAGNVSEARLTVYLDDEAPKDTTTTVPGWVFTASQKYGSCSEPVPYDVFSGKAQPGTTVTVTSAHGGGSTTANDDGKWSLQVEFPSAPYNEQFTVTVKDHTGATKTFPFISLYEG